MRRFVVSAVFLVMAGCASTKIIQSGAREGYEGRLYDKILVVAITDQNDSQRLFENRVASQLHRKGLDVGVGHEFFRSSPENMDPEDIRQMIEEAGFDAAVSVALVRRKFEATYSSANYATLTYEGFYTYYPAVSGRVATPAGGAEKTTFVLEAKFYDLSSTEASWSALSETVNPQDARSFADDYAKSLVGRLYSDQVIRKK